MNTSYFAKYKGTNGVSVCLYTPKWFSGEKYSKLAPTKQILFLWKNEQITEQEYEKMYRDDVLSKLNPQEVYNDLKGCVLLCFEKTGVFCHRHIIASWLYECLDIEEILEI